MRSSKTPIRTVACVVGLGLMFVQAAFAADKQPVKFNAADQAAAKAVMITASDLGAGWKGGALKYDLNQDIPCAMKRSDLMLTGAARSEFKAQGALVISESNVLQSRAMVAADWQRSVGSDTFMACVGKAYTKQGGPNTRVVSFKKIAFPKLSQYTTRYRMLADYGEPGASVRVLVDMIFLARGRTEISFVLSTPYADRAAADVVERRLAQTVVRRIAA
jgi:hypothetical protein